MKLRLKGFISAVIVICMLFSILGTVTFASAIAPTIYLAGDSIVVGYPASFYPQQGWGYYVEQNLEAGGATVVNCAKAGETSKSFYNTYFNDLIYSKLNAGDYVIISFGTNDAGQSGIPINDYANQLKAYISDIRSKNAIPVFVTFPRTCGGISWYDNYAEKMKSVAEEESVSCIDLRKVLGDYMYYVKGLETTPEADKADNVVPEAIKNEMYLHNLKDGFGLTDSDIQNHPNSLIRTSSGDFFHFNENGAKKLARWILNEIYLSDKADLKKLSQYIQWDEIAPTIYLIGDSLVTEYDGKFNMNWYPQQGWGHYLGDFFNNANVVNKAEHGETTATSYYKSNYFPSVKSALKDGDYVLICLGTNDYNYRNDPETFTVGGVSYKKGAAIEEYKANLKKYIDDVHSYGAYPVLVTWSNASYEYNSMSNYIDAMRDVAKNEGIALIDLRQKHLDYIKSITGTESVNSQCQDSIHMTNNALKNVFNMSDEDIAKHPNAAVAAGGNDTVHLNQKGAEKMAEFVAEEIKEDGGSILGYLSKFMGSSVSKFYPVEISSLKVNKNSDSYDIDALVKADSQIEKAMVVAAVFNGNILVGTNMQKVQFSENSGEIKDLILEVAPSDNYEIKLFVWDDFLSMKPLSEKISPLNTTISIEEKANGVVLNWNSVDGASSYDIYRDNKKIATVKNSEYEDVYFKTIEEMKTVDTSLKHSYSVKVDGKTSADILGGADTSLIKYIDFSKANVTDGTTLDQLNAGANGINVAANGVGLADTFLFDVSDTAKEYTLADLTTMTTKYEALYKYASKSNGIVAIDNNEKALILSGNVHKKSDNSKLTDLTLFTKVTGWQDSGVDDYTVLLTQKTNNEEINSASLRWGVWYDDVYTYDDGKLDKVKAISENGIESYVTVASDKLSFKPIIDNTYHTYVYDTKLRLDEKSTKFTGNASVDANLCIRNGGETTGDATLIRSFALVKKSDYINKTDNLIELNLLSVNKANGVSLSWTNVSGASSYDVYRDGKKIATVTGNSYDDKYFSTVAELSSDTNGEYGKAHTYSVSAGNVNSNLVSARADTSLLKYFTVDSITVRPTTLAGVNAKSNGISLVPNPQVAVDINNISVTDTAQTYNFNNNSYTTKYTAEKTATNTSLCFNIKNKAIELTNCVYIHSGQWQGRNYPKNSPQKVYFDVNIRDASEKQYTYLIEQRVNNIGITSVRVPKNHKGGFDYIVGKVNAVSADGVIQNVNVNTETQDSYTPINDSNFYTYIFDVKRVIDACSANAGDVSYAANIGIVGNGSVDNADGSSNIELRSLGVVRSDMYIK